MERSHVSSLEPLVMLGLITRLVMLLTSYSRSRTLIFFPHSGALPLGSVHLANLRALVCIDDSLAASVPRICLQVAVRPIS